MVKTVACCVTVCSLVQNPNALRNNIIHYGPSLEITGVQNWPLVVNYKVYKQQTIDHCLDIQTYKRQLKILSLLVDFLQVSHVGYCFFSAELSNILLYRNLWRIYYTLLFILLLKYVFTSFYVLYFISANLTNTMWMTNQWRILFLLVGIHMFSSKFID